MVSHKKWYSIQLPGCRVPSSQTMVLGDIFTPLGGV